MTKLNVLALSAILIPALALGSMAFAGDDDDRTQADQHREGDQQREGDREGGQQHAASLDEDDQDNGEQQLSGKPKGAMHADEIIGKTVKHRGSDEDIGEIQNLIIGEDGDVVGLVVTTGGFLGLGGQDVGLGWDYIEHTQEDGEAFFYVDMEEDALREAPEYEQD